MRNCWAHNIQPGSRICPASPHGGNCIIGTPTRRRHAEAKLLMPQNPHRSQPEVHRAASKTGAVPVVATKLAQHGPSSDSSAKKTRPARQKTPILSYFSCAGRPFSRSRRDNVATLKPTTPLLASSKGPLKPTSPLRPKTGPKSPISLPQRRWRFQSHAGTSEQRRSRFQTTGPPGRQRQAATPAGGRARLRPLGGDDTTAPKFRMQFDWVKFQ